VSGAPSLISRHGRAPVPDDAPDRANTVMRAIFCLGEDQVDAAVIARCAPCIDDRDVTYFSRGL